MSNSSDAIAYSASATALELERNGTMENRRIEMDMNQVHMVTMTPAKIRECVFRNGVVSGPGIYEQAMPSSSELDTINAMCNEAISDGRFIDFGFWPNDLIKDSSKRGGPLYSQSALGHPFNSPWMFMHTWSDPESGLAKRFGDHGPYYSAYLVNPLLRDKPNSLGCDVEIMSLESMSIHGKFMLAVGDRALMSPLPNEDRYACSVVPMMWRFPVSESLTQSMLDARFTNMEHLATANVLDPLMTALLILNTRGIRSQTVTAATKLNTARIKRGRQPIPPYRTIDSTDYVTALLARQERSKGHASSDGHHASPVPHIRRGHWRHYQSGERTFINDTLVKVEPALREQFRSQRSHYQMKE